MSLPLRYGFGNVDYQQRINWEEVRKKRMERAHKFMAKYGIGAAIVYSHDRSRYLMSLINHPYALQTPKRFVLFIRDAGFPYISADKAMDYSQINEDAPMAPGEGVDSR